VATGGKAHRLPETMVPGRFAGCGPKNAYLRGIQFDVVTAVGPSSA